jgi:AAA+ ATPase superfamily predicted ATPase
MRPLGLLGRELRNPVSPLLVSGERSLAAEFPETAMARSVLAAIGSGERSFGNIARAAGGISGTTLARALDVLVSKRIVAAELPLSTNPSKDRRYRVTDPYLRFWLTFVGPHLPEIERLPGDLAIERVKASWTSWSGRAIEPLLRDSLARLLPEGDLPAANNVGAYWTRTNSIEVDVVGADQAPVAKRLLFLGSIKWLESSPFDNHDLLALQRHRGMLTGEPVPLVAISRSGVDARGLDATYGPEELIRAWRV